MKRIDTASDTLEHHPDEKVSEVIDGKTGELQTPPKRLDLSNLRDVRLEMAAVYREVKAKTMDSTDGYRRVIMLRQIADVITGAEMEKRVREIEDRLEAKGALRSPVAGLLATH